VTVGMAELDQVVQQLLSQDRQATAAIAAVPTGVVGAVPSRVVGALARLGLVALLQREEAAMAAALPRVVGPELCAAVRAGAGQASSNGAANCRRCRTIWPACAPSGTACFLGLSRLICSTAVAAAGKSTTHSLRPRHSRQPMD
jgi:hypothetical protein